MKNILRIAREVYMCTSQNIIIKSLCLHKNTAFSVFDFFFMFKVIDMLTMVV